ncbi:MAG TPA: flagellar type III secretion system pore protein FliP [Gemmatimonadaceae bacterium]|nr:flagellar type III secretion system pore protein FliP [Gemmatimonadaceae bacterium]
MSAGSLLGVVATLALVLGLMAVALRLLRRFATTGGTGRGRLPMEVVQRVALGPKQGIAVVRIGERLLAVSLGEGGVRPLAELGEAERALLDAPARAPKRGSDPAHTIQPATPVRRAALLSPLPPIEAVTPDTPPAPVGTSARPGVDATDFRTMLRAALGGGLTALLPFVLATSLAASLAVAPDVAHAQAPPAPAATGALQPPVSVSGQPPRRATLQPPAPRARQAAQSTPGQEPPAIARVDTMVQRLAPQMDLRVGDAAGGLRLSGTVGVVIMMGLLTLLPTLLLMMTGFTRILIVLHFLRQAMGTQSAPPAHLVAGLALLLTGFVMAPTLKEANETAIQPWLDGRIEQAEMMREGVKPFREFMVAQTRESDIRAFLDMSEAPEPETVEEVPLVVLMSAFVVSELRTAFQIGFALFLPFIVIDVVVSSVLMSMGMFMLPPAMISLPFKLLLFVLVDGWSLLVQSLVQSVR